MFDKAPTNDNTRGPHVWACIAQMQMIRRATFNPWVGLAGRGGRCRRPAVAVGFVVAGVAFVVVVVALVVYVVCVGFVLVRCVVCIVASIVVVVVVRVRV